MQALDDIDRHITEIMRLSVAEVIPNLDDDQDQYDYTDQLERLEQFRKHIHSIVIGE